MSIKLTEGKTFYQWRDPYKYHVVKVFRDNKHTFIVYKYYGKHRQYWHYEIRIRREIIAGICARRRRGKGG